jgi:hypothetical protein
MQGWAELLHKRTYATTHSIHIAPARRQGKILHTQTRARYDIFQHHGKNHFPAAKAKPENNRGLAQNISGDQARQNTTSTTTRNKTIRIARHVERRSFHFAIARSLPSRHREEPPPSSLRGAKRRGNPCGGAITRSAGAGEKAMDCHGPAALAMTKWGGFRNAVTIHTALQVAGALRKVEAPLVISCSAMIFACGSPDGRVSVCYRQTVFCRGVHFMHAGSILFLWMAAALCVQVAEGWRLAVLAAASLAVALALARARCARLLVRVRALLLAIIVLFAWFTPGEAVFADWPRLSPSREGLLLALVHAGRLLAIVCWTAVLLARMPPGRLVSGLYALARPCAVFGLSAERVAMRLLLVLRYVDEARLDGRGWRYWLSPPPAGGFEAVRLARERPGMADAGLLAAFAVLLGMWWLW